FDERVDRRDSLELGPRPRRGEIAPLGELPRSPAEPIDRRVFARGVPEALPDGSPERPANPFGRVLELTLDPAAERLIEQPRSLGLRQHREQGIDARLDGTLAQQLRAEAVDRTDVRV